MNQVMQVGDIVNALRKGGVTVRETPSVQTKTVTVNRVASECKFKCGYKNNWVPGMVMHQNHCFNNPKWNILNMTGTTCLKCGMPAGTGKQFKGHQIGCDGDPYTTIIKHMRGQLRRLALVDPARGIHIAREFGSDPTANQKSNAYRLHVEVPQQLQSRVKPNNLKYVTNLIKPQLELDVHNVTTDKDNSDNESIVEVPSATVVTNVAPEAPVKPSAASAVKGGTSTPETLDALIDAIEDMVQDNVTIRQFREWRALTRNLFAGMK